MVATNEGRRSSRTHAQKSRRDPQAAVPADDHPAASGGLPASRGAAPASRANRIVPPRVSARQAERRILAVAATVDTLDVRERLRRLAGLVSKDGRNARRMAFLEAAIGECLDDVTRSSSPASRWTSCEATTWALAWMARTKRAGGSAGGLLERLVGQARSAQPLLASGDTQAARFVLVLAKLFADVEACRCLEAGAAATVAAEMERLVSAEGIPHLNGSSAMVERVVRWTSVREIAGGPGSDAWSKETERRWRKAATAVLRLLGDRGRALAGAGRMPESLTRPLLDALADCGQRRKRTITALRRNRAAADGRGLVGRDLHDAAAGVAIIRTGWDRRSVRVMLDYRHPVPRLEIAVGDRLLVDGPWQWEAWADGRSVEPEAGWTVSCWESDKKATFLEITAPLGSGRQIERQVVVLPQDRIVLLADAVTTVAAPAALRYRGSLPVAASLDVEPAAETREVVLADTRPRLLAMPLALSEWRAGGGGDFRAEAGGLVLEQEGTHRLYAPLWLDCDPRRIGRPLTWRQLTVADTRIILPRHQAAGFRVQTGLEQWLLYRALDVARNRTLLGCNVSCEFLLGRVRKRGAVARTLEIQ
jgi:hypothetical protein